VATHCKRITIKPGDMHLVRDIIYTFDPENLLGHAHPERIAELQRLQRAAEKRRRQELADAREKKRRLMAARRPVLKKLEHFTKKRLRGAIVGRG
jgi:hypothetical protein